MQACICTRANTGNCFWGVNCCVNTCRACICTRANTGNCFQINYFHKLAKFLGEFISVRVRAAAVFAPKCTVSRRWFAVKICDSSMQWNCTQRFFLGNRLRFLSGNDTIAVAMHSAMKDGQICFSLRKFLAISPAIQKIASGCGCDAVVHLGSHPRESRKKAWPIIYVFS